MRTQMFSSILSLVKSQWIVETDNSVSRNDVDGVDYSFVHPLFYRTLYDLTPAGDKARLHYAVASYIEQSYEGKPSHYAQLGRHFGVAKDCRPKALEYYVRAAVTSLLNGPLFYDQVLELLMKAKEYSDSAMDYASILGILIDGNQRLTDSRKNLLQWIQEDASEKQSSWKAYRMFNRRSNRVRSAPACPMPTIRLAAKLEIVDKFVLVFSEMEETVNASYLRMVDLNRVGVVSDWQRPYLKVWKDSMCKGDELIRKSSVSMDRKESRRSSKLSLRGTTIKKCLRKFSIDKNMAEISSQPILPSNRSIVPLNILIPSNRSKVQDEFSEETSTLPLTASQLFNEQESKNNIEGRFICVSKNCKSIETGCILS